jgi:hypothetical protein
MVAQTRLPQAPRLQKKGCGTPPNSWSLRRWCLRWPEANFPVIVRPAH